MITYPVNPASRFTFKLGANVKRGQLWPRADGMQLQGQQAGAIALEEFVPVPPAFNPATQKLDDGTWIDDPANERTTFTRTVVQLTTAELNQISLDAAKQTERDQAKSIISTFKSGSATNAQVQKAIAILLTDLYNV